VKGDRIGSFAILVKLYVEWLAVEISRKFWGNEEAEMEDLGN